MMLNTSHFTPPPGHILHQYVHSIFSANGKLAKEHISPEGVVDIIFNFGEPIETRSISQFRSPLKWEKVLLSGLRTTSFFSLPGGSVNFIGVSLHASYSRELIPFPLDEIADQMIDASLIFPETNELWLRLGETRKFHDQCNILLDWLQLYLKPQAQIKFIVHACQELDQFPEAKTMDAIFQVSGLSTRHVRRLFHQYVGITPGHYMRIARFIKAIHLMNTSMTLTEIAYNSHYYDQAHFCRDFNDLTNMTAKEYRALMGPVPGHLFYH